MKGGPTVITLPKNPLSYSHSLAMLKAPNIQRTLLCDLGRQLGYAKNGLNIDNMQTSVMYNGETYNITVVALQLWLRQQRSFNSGIILKGKTA
ncbi:hypothetical protein OUZ56_029502 [Daphnia magna]|uniref:Uncharacterized protein n=1 Tax=Daphnia magna TaxID=35525 RepID=A0ABR0B713_9CRUS|nr:hypothetical protein OUZ56_029502 [Daphnia magna]